MSKLGAFEREIELLQQIVNKEVSRKIERELIFGINSRPFIKDDIQESEIFIDIFSFFTEIIEHPHPMCDNFQDLLRLK